MGTGEELAPPWLPRVVRGDQGRLSPMDCPSFRSRRHLFLHLAFDSYPHFLFCAIVPSTSPAVLYFFLFPFGVWDRIDPLYCVCCKRRLTQCATRELPLSGTSATSLSLHLALLLSSLPFLRYRSVHFSSYYPLLLSTVALRCWE
ncbi:hypothetical protein PoB_004601800 [Plakobranchus ocellatus]|uniref:Uncharacterized protein n=1 Tax=Plakobranchus ocellatus TaxID=259542 RepID=A0AAV4BL20_9GAST|nr:hypothetical protein PoB_004601800 [Plakobranchus ocellatus]